MKKRVLSMVLTLLMLISPTFTTFAASSKKNKENVDKDAAIIQEQINTLIEEEGISSEEPGRTMELILVTDGTDITEQMAGIGLHVEKMSTSVFVSNVPINKLNMITYIKGIKSIGKEKMLYLPKPVITDETNIITNLEKPNMEYAHETSGIAKLWKMGFDGRNTKIAIIDTGADPAHEMLTLTPDGKIKIVDYKDFWKNTAPGYVSEGDVEVNEYPVLTTQSATSVQQNGSTTTQPGIQLPEGLIEYIYVNGKNYVLPQNILSQKVYFGCFNEAKVIGEDDNGNKKVHDVNNNGKTNDLIGVLVLNNTDDSKLNDEIYVDTNLNDNFSDEKPMVIFGDNVNRIQDSVIFDMNEKGLILDNGKPKVKTEYQDIYNKLFNKFHDLKTGNNHPGTEFNFVITEVEERSGKWYVNLGYDGNGHGTHVSGDAAGNGYVSFPFVDTNVKDKFGNSVTDGTIKGSAPGAQLIICRVFQSTGGTPQSAYMAAIEYACEKGADVVNMSLGSLPDLNDQREPSTFLINQLSKKYGTVFCISAGNSGPGINTIGTPSTAEWAISVGAYNSSWYNYGDGRVRDSLWYFSSVAPTEDGRLKPTIIAPGSMISSYPMWYAGIESEIRGNENPTVGHGLMQGTSQASPYAAGIVAAIKQAVNEYGLPYHPLLIKEALFETGNKTINNGRHKPVEIGGGLIEPDKALGYIVELANKGLSNSLLIDRSLRGYIDRNEMVLKTEVYYSEKLNYNPEGLYVRSGDIPSEVAVKITNTKNIPVNITMTKDTYGYSSDWLQLSDNTMKIYPGESAVLMLNIDRKKLEQGVNSAIIRLDDPATPIKEGIIPVTIANYMDLNENNPVMTENQSRDLDLEDVDRHFIRVPNGAKKLEINIQRNNENDFSVLQPILYQPTGIQLVRDDLTLLRLKNTQSYKIILDNPQPGTWELVMRCRGISSTIAYGDKAVTGAKGQHKVTAAIRGLFFNPSVIQVNGNPQETIKKDIKVFNLAGDDVEKSLVKFVAGMYGNNTNVKRTTQNIANGKTQIIKYTVTKDDPNVLFSIKTGNPANENDDIDLELYKIVGGKLQKIASSGREGSDEEITLESLDPGTYALVIFAYDTAENTSYELTEQIINISNLEKTVNLSQNEIEIGKEPVELGLNIKLQEDKSVYKGVVYAFDKDNNTLGYAKIMADTTGTTPTSSDKISIKTIDAPANFRNGSDASLTIEAKNDLRVAKNVTLIVAVFEKDTNRFITYSASTTTLKPGDKHRLTSFVNIPLVGNYYVKCFVWDSISSGKVLSDSIMIPVLKP